MTSSTSYEHCENGVYALTPVRCSVHALLKNLVENGIHALMPVRCGVCHATDAKQACNMVDIRKAISLSGADRQRQHKSMVAVQALPTAALFVWKMLDFTFSCAAIPRLGYDRLAAVVLLMHADNATIINNAELDCCQLRHWRILEQ